MSLWWCTQGFCNYYCCFFLFVFCISLTWSMKSCKTLILWVLTHWGRVTHICVSKLTIIDSDNGLSLPSHYLNQCWNIVNWILRNKLQWNFIWKSDIFIQENALENVVCEMASILSQPQCLKTSLKKEPSRYQLIPTSLLWFPPTIWMKQSWCLITS